MYVFRWQVLENKSSLLRHCIFIPSVYGSMKYISNFNKKKRWVFIVKGSGQTYFIKMKALTFFCIIFSFLKSRKRATKVFSLNVTFFLGKHTTNFVVVSISFAFHLTFIGIWLEGICLLRMMKIYHWFGSANHRSCSHQSSMCACLVLACFMNFSSIVRQLFVSQVIQVINKRII